VNLPTYLLRKLAGAVPLLIGVTLLSFTLMVYFGPDVAQLLVGRNATAEELAAARQALGYDQAFALRYLHYLRDLVTLDFGASATTGEPVADILLRSLPVTLVLVTPGFVLGNLLGLASALLAAFHRERWPDRAITAAATAAMSISFLIVAILCQVAFSSNEGLGLFPVRGWRVDGLASYLYHVTVPTLALTFATWGFNTRFYRAVLVEELDQHYVLTGLAFGAPRGVLLVGAVLRNAAIPIITRLLFSIPLVVLSASLVLERYFGIPGLGEVTYTAVTSGNQPVLKAVVSLSALAFVLLQALADGLYGVLDPRVTRE
jgi:peptide/nickel transport system permease protein